MREAASADPDVIVGTGYYPDQLLVAKAVKALAPDIQALYGVANGAFDDENFPNDAGAAGEGVLSANYHYDAASERTAGHPQALRAGVRRADADRVRAVLPGRRGHRAGAGGGRAPPTRPTCARPSPGISLDDPLLAFDGPIEFDETGQNTNATVVVMQVQGDEGRAGRPRPSSRPPR